jgi:hypothetical protein
VLRDKVFGGEDPERFVYVPRVAVVESSTAMTCGQPPEHTFDAFSFDRPAAVVVPAVLAPCATHANVPPAVEVAAYTAPPAVICWWASSCRKRGCPERRSTARLRHKR